MTNDTVIINIGDKTMERVFRATGITNVHESNLQEIFDRIEEVLSEQCLSVKEGYRVIACKPVTLEPGVGYVEDVCSLSEALTIRSGEEVRREALGEAAKLADVYKFPIADLIRDLIDTPAPSTDTTNCLECNDTGMRDSGGVHPWGEHIDVPCDCKGDTTPSVVDVEALAKIVAFSGPMPEKREWGHLLPETRQHYRKHAEAIIAALAAQTGGE